MGGTARQFNKMYIDYKKKFKKPIQQIAVLMHNKNNILIKYGKKSRYNFRKPYNFILDCSYHCRKKLRKESNRSIISEEERKIVEKNVYEKSIAKLRKREAKIQKALYYVQEIEPKYASKFIDKYFWIHDLHEKLEIIRELSKYKSEKIERGT